jgi:hypothetical protein
MHANFIRHAENNRLQQGGGDHIPNNILNCVTATPSLGSGSGNNEYDGRNGAHDEPEAEAFVQ